MPIYEYQCGACGQLQEFLQKMSDAPRTTCVHCGKEALTKRVTAAGFQLKGSGWYVTDFRNGSSKPDTKATPPSGSAATTDGKPASATDAGAGSSSTSPSPAASPSAAPAGASPAAGA